MPSLLASVDGVKEQCRCFKYQEHTEEHIEEQFEEHIEAYIEGHNTAVWSNLDTTALGNQQLLSLRPCILFVL